MGILSGVFGIGGGFLLTPLLIFMGIPAPVAVATQSNQIAAQSLVGLKPHWERGSVDIKMGAVLLVGGLFGSSFGVWIFSLLQKLGQIDLIISLLYVILLAFIGSSMMLESLSTWFRQKQGYPIKERSTHYWAHHLPFKMKFRKSGLYMSILLPLSVSFAIGILSALMGVGGGFLLVPAMIYIIGIPTRIVVGTSLFQIMLVSMNVTMLQAYTTQMVDVVLALILLIGGAIGITLGANLSRRLRADQLRFYLSIVILLLAIKLILDLVTMPEDLYNIHFIERILQ